MVLLAETLGGNTATKLRKLTVHPCLRSEDDHSRKDIYSAYLNMLETNTTLTHLDIDVSEHEFDSDVGNWYFEEELDYVRKKCELDMYLKLNKHGRGSLLTDPSKVPLEAWVQVFEQLDDVACINYYLTRLPWLINTGFEVTGASVGDT